MAAETEAWLAEATFQFQDARVVGQTEATSEWLEQTGALDHSQRPDLMSDIPE